MGKFRSVSKLLKKFESVSEIYEAFIKKEPKLKNEIRFKKLRAQEEYVLYFDDAFYDLMTQTMLALGINFVDEDLNSFVVSNIPLDEDANFLVPTLSPIIGNYFYVDYFPVHRNSKNRSARIHVPVGYWEEEEGKQLEMELRPYKDGTKPYIKAECPPPYANILYIRLYIPGEKPKLIQKRQRNYHEEKNSQNQDMQEKQNYQASKDNTTDENDKEKTKIEILIEQNKRILQQSKIQGEEIRAAFKKVNHRIDNLNSLVGQLFSQMNLIDQNLLALLTDKTISTEAKLELVNENVLLQNEDAQNQVEAVVEETVMETATEIKGEVKSSKKEEVSFKKALMKAAEVDLPQSPELPPQQEEQMEVDCVTQGRKRNLTGTRSPPTIKKKILPSTTNQLERMELKEKASVHTEKIQEIRVIKEKIRI